MAAVEHAELVSRSASELASLIASRRVSAREAVTAHIERIESIDDKLHAVVVPLFTQALLDAEQADRMNPEGRPLHGVPITVKESYDVRGTPSTLGVTGRRSLSTATDAALVAKLREAGAIIVAKTNVPQLLIYVEADNPLYGRTNNPWNLERTPGGSSGGEGAALAAGYSALGLGTDIGGSLRIPAHFCGIQSLKPTPDRLSLEGMVADPLFRFSGIRDAAGPLARNVKDLYLAMAALGAPVPQVSTKGLRVGVYDDDGYFPASTAIRRAVREASAALESAGCIIEPFQVPNINDVLHAFYGLLTVDGGRGVKAFMEDSAYDPRIKDCSSRAFPIRCVRWLPDFIGYAVSAAWLNWSDGLADSPSKERHAWSPCARRLASSF